MRIYTYTYGYLDVQIWEYPAYFLLLLLMIIWCYRKQRQNIESKPGYRFFLPAFLVKVFGGIGFALIYIYYYKGGDTTNYFESSLPFVHLFWEDPVSFFRVYFGGGTAELRSLFNHDTGYPMGTYFFNDHTRAMVKVVVPLLIISGKSFFICTLWFSFFTFLALWKVYEVFLDYFPHVSRKLAIGVLFMPSLAFWGSGILKDSVSLAATCFFVAAVNEIILKRSSVLGRIARLAISGFMIIVIKPYILIILLPGTMIWFFYAKIRTIKNAYFRTVIVPFTYLFILVGSYSILTSLGDRLGKFAPERALQTAVVTQHDLKQEYYGGNSFDIGEFEPTYTSLVSKFPAASTAGLFRPFLWESNNVVMLLSALENTFMLVMTILVIVGVKWSRMRRLISDYPIILYSLIFSFLFSFMIGITTANFGALVRFKIPLIPFYMASIMVMHTSMVSVKVKKRRKWAF